MSNDELVSRAAPRAVWNIIDDLLQMHINSQSGVYGVPLADIEKASAVMFKARENERS